jgi:outer membrane protein assembly factor BamB
MLKMARGLLCFCLSVTLWQAASAEPWTVAVDPDPQPAGIFTPDVFSEFAADGYWASGVVQNREVRTSALIRFDAEGRQQARSFGGSNMLKRLADGGVLYAATGRTDVRFDLSVPLCRIVRLHADGRTVWQTVLDGSACLGLDIDAADEIWVATGINTVLRITQVVRLHDDGSIATRIALDDPLQTLVEMRVDPVGAGVFVAGHRVEAGNPQAARARIQRLRPDGSVGWLWQSGVTATASSVKHLRVSASGGIFALSSRFAPSASEPREKEWLAAGLSLDGVPRFETKIKFDDRSSIVGASTVDAAGLWLVLQQGGNGSDGANDRKVSVVRLSASGKLASSHTINGAQEIPYCADVSAPCALALRRDGGLWLLVYDESSSQGHSIVGVDATGRERARLPVSSGFGLLPDDRALVVTGFAVPGPISAQRIGFGQPAEPWSQLSVPGRALAPAVEAVASDGAVAQWLALPGPNGRSTASEVTFRSADAAPVSWRIEFASVRDVQLSVSSSMVCLAGWGSDASSVHYVLECRRRADGSLLWQDTRPATPSRTIDRFQAIAALEDGRAVAISSEYGSLRQWAIGVNGEVLSERSLPLLGSAQQELQINRVAFNAHGDALLAGFDRTRHGGSLLRLDHDGQERFRTAFEGVFITYGDITQDRLAFAGDGGAVMYGSVTTRYSASGEKLWELTPDRPVVDLVVDDDTIMFSMRSGEGLFSMNPGDWEVVALDSATGSERWRRALAAPFQWSAGIALLAPQRLAVLQTEVNHLRYRELDVASGTLLREQTDDCGGEICECRSAGFCGQSVAPPLPLQSLDGRLRARLRTLQAGIGPGSSVLFLDDAGEVPRKVRADQNGVNGVWSAPWSSGQGLVLDWIADARTLFATWLTFAPDGGNDPSGLRWYTLQGVLADPSAGATLDIMSNEGGRFGVGATASRRVGSARLRFESCERAQFSYQFDPDENEGLSGLVTLSRLTPGVACSGSPAGTSSPTVSDAIDGAWFDPASSGQGLMFNTIPAQDTLFATWFTYDTETAPDDLRQQHWFTLQGSLGSGGQSTLAILRTTGGALFRVPTSNSQRVGTATVTRLGCDHLRLEYQFDDSDIAGPFRRIDDFRDLQRIGGCAD